MISCQPPRYTEHNANFSILGKTVVVELHRLPFVSIELPRNKVIVADDKEAFKDQAQFDKIYNSL